jgi:hypothetical protein
MALRSTKYHEWSSSGEPPAGIDVLVMEAIAARRNPVALHVESHRMFPGSSTWVKRRTSGLFNSEPSRWHLSAGIGYDRFYTKRFGRCTRSS